MSYPITLPLNETPLATLSHPSPELWELEMSHGVDNRLTAHFIVNVLGKTLDIVEKDWRTQGSKTPGALIISGKKDQEKFFSNGHDFAAIAEDRTFFPEIYNKFLARLLTYPIPTIAAINGHAFAGGFILTLACDYRVMTAGKGWCCMNEVLFGAPLPTSFTAILNYRLGSPAVVRKASLEAYRFTSQELHAHGVVDIVAEGGTPGVLKAARELALQRAPLAKTGVWGLIKKDVLRPTLEVVLSDYRVVMPFQEAELALSKL